MSRVAGTTEARVHGGENGDAVSFAVSGMTCDGCATSLRLTLGELPGVDVVDVKVGAGEVRLTGPVVDAGEARSRIERLGYRIGEAAESTGPSAFGLALAALLVSLRIQLASDALFSSNALTCVSHRQHASAAANRSSVTP